MTVTFFVGLYLVVFGLGIYLGVNIAMTAVTRKWFTREEVLYHVAQIFGKDIAEKAKRTKRYSWLKDH